MSQRHVGWARPSRWRVPLAVASVGVAVIGAGVAWHAWPPGAGLGSAGSGTPVAARREARPTLDPAEFLGKARLAYQVAREIPDVLDQLRCYCECDRYYGHTSLLSCYTDQHGST